MIRFVDCEGHFFDEDSVIVGRDRLKSAGRRSDDAFISTRVDSGAEEFQALERESM